MNHGEYDVAHAGMVLLFTPDMAGRGMYMTGTSVGTWVNDLRIWLERSGIE